ncbi:reticulon-like protein B11 isoform X2 [Gossypium arboreum]|uniref:reticulon-like protein B11 isoform X2 n=1 Tax=Gossypium arboreum TaxID=29729 RepID=UPI0022F192F1|nr:reticulon-like protein B11 isoform X2 [Gossypium arboreum]
MADSNPTARISVHQALGGGTVADVLLWREWCSGVVMLTLSTMVWYLFERAGYNFLSFMANVLSLLVAILFFWAKSASLLNRSLPPLPNLEISENTVVIITDELHQWINHTLSIAHNIAIARDLKFFLKVAVSLWLVSYMGSLFEFLTLVYIVSVGVILSLSVPVVYDTYQHFIDEKLYVTRRFIQTQYRKIDEMVLRKLPLPSNGGYPLHS